MIRINLIIKNSLKFPKIKNKIISILLYLIASFSSTSFFTISREEKILSLQNVIIWMKSGTESPNLDMCSDSPITSVI